ncbi:MAG: hypothetical protein LBP74_08375 [Treponema sp.]|jgi:hypothetical protein|nr:hypothetical protein [Treponema sp.]
MNRRSWKAFTAAREHFREIAGVLQRELPELQSIQQKLIDRRTGPAYRVETPIVYNRALDGIGPGDEIGLILVADNPGRREQAAENRYYLAGPSGKLAEKFFRDQPSLGIDFRKNVLILNKTPIHTPRTAELRELGRLGGTHIAEAIAGSQLAMAGLVAEFHAALGPVPVWIIGYSEMRRGGIFETFTGALEELCNPRGVKPRAKQGRLMKDLLFLYRHFSMNQFTIDLHRQAAPGEDIKKALDRIGRAYREQILTGISKHASLPSSHNDA